MDTLTGIEDFLQTKISAAQIERDRLGARIAQFDLELVNINDQLKQDSVTLEQSRLSNAYSIHEGISQ
jgi:hypothetical protein